MLDERFGPGHFGSGNRFVVFPRSGQQQFVLGFGLCDSFAGPDERLPRRDQVLLRDRPAGLQLFAAIVLVDFGRQRGFGLGNFRGAGRNLLWARPGFDAAQVKLGGVQVGLPHSQLGSQLAVFEPEQQIAFLHALAFGNGDFFDHAWKRRTDRDALAGWLHTPEAATALVNGARAGATMGSRSGGCSCVRTR